MVQNLERIASFEVERNIALKWSMSKRTAQQMTRLKWSILRFVIDGNEKADALAKEGAMLDEGFMAETRAQTVQQEREEVYAALQYEGTDSPAGERRGVCSFAVCSQLSLLGGGMERL